MKEYLLALEIIGTISFALSGTLVAIRAKLDVFGVLVIGCITAVGGGIIRDMLLGTVPPVVFTRLYILLIAVVTSLAVFIISYAKRKHFFKMEMRVKNINNVFDAIGLATFTVMGTELAFTHTACSGNVVLILFIGALTAVGGGVIRDVLTGSKPYIFVKHVYVIASLAGAGAYYCIRLLSSTNVWLPSVIGMAIIIVLRLLATKYQWNLPKIKDLGE